MSRLVFLRLELALESKPTSDKSVSTMHGLFADVPSMLALLMLETAGSSSPMLAMMLIFCQDACEVFDAK